MADIYLIPGPGPGPVKSLATYLVGWYMYHVCEPASKQEIRPGGTKLALFLLLGMSRDRRIALWHVHTSYVHMLVLHTYFASLGDKVTVIANGRARIFFLCRCGTYMFPCSPPPFGGSTG